MVTVKKDGNGKGINTNIERIQYLLRAVHMSMPVREVTVLKDQQSCVFFFGLIVPMFCPNHNPSNYGFDVNWFT